MNKSSTQTFISAVGVLAVIVDVVVSGEQRRPDNQFVKPIFYCSFVVEVKSAFLLLVSCHVKN